MEIRGKNVWNASMKMSPKALASKCSDEIPDNEMRKMESYLAWLSSGFIVFTLVRMLLAKSPLFKNLDDNIRYLIAFCPRPERGVRGNKCRGRDAGVKQHPRHVFGHA